MNCPTCDYPMVWSTDRERMWCSVYGDHLTLLNGRHPVVSAILAHEGHNHAPSLRLIEGKAS